MVCNKLTDEEFEDYLNQRYLEYNEKDEDKYQVLSENIKNIEDVLKTLDKNLHYAIKRINEQEKEISKLRKLK